MTHKVQVCNTLNSVSLILLAWFLRYTSILRPHLLKVLTKSAIKSYITCLTNHMGFILQHIMLLGTNNRVCMHTCLSTSPAENFRNQISTSLWLVHAWFKILTIIIPYSHCGLTRIARSNTTM